jgi:hypothetical protein
MGSHKKGAPLKTLDDVYLDAQKVVETQLTEHWEVIHCAAPRLGKRITGSKPVAARHS